MTHEIALLQDRPMMVTHDSNHPGLYIIDEETVHRGQYTFVLSTSVGMICQRCWQDNCIHTKLVEKYQEHHRM
jgi:hypothetical protein